MRKEWKDMLGANFIRIADGKDSIELTDVQDRLRSYFQDLLNVENPNVLEYIIQLRLVQMKKYQFKKCRLPCVASNVARSFDLKEVTTELFFIARDQGTDMLCSVFNNIQKNVITPEK